MTMTRRLLPLLIALLLALAPLALAQDDGEPDGGQKDDADKAREEAEKAAEEEAEKAQEEAEKAREESEKAAEDAEKDGRDEADEVKRKVEVESSDDEAVVKLARESGEAEDEVKLVYAADEGSMKVEYKTENASAEAETELKVRFRQAVEYVDADGDGAYDPAKDEAVATHGVEDLDWTVTAPADVTSASGIPGKRFEGVGAFRDGGTLAFVFVVYGDFADVNGTTLRPTDVKIDIVLDGFPYARNDTAVALLFKHEAKAEVKRDDESLAATSASGWTAYFEWAPTAVVDGVERPVHSTVVEEKTETEADEAKAEQAFYLSYPRGASIVHDPVMGVASAGSATAVNPTPGPGALAVVAVAVSAALLLARRRR